MHTTISRWASALTAAAGAAVDNVYDRVTRTRRRARFLASFDHYRTLAMNVPGAGPTSDEYYHLEWAYADMAADHAAMDAADRAAFRLPVFYFDADYALAVA